MNGLAHRTSSPADYLDPSDSQKRFAEEQRPSLPKRPTLVNSPADTTWLTPPFLVYRSETGAFMSNIAHFQHLLA
jgi:hypothetical protein